MWELLQSESTNKGHKLQQASEQQQFYRTVKDVDLWLDEVENQLESDDLGKVSESRLDVAKHTTNHTRNVTGSIKCAKVAKTSELARNGHFQSQRPNRDSFHSSPAI